MCSFICSFTLLMFIFILVLDGSPALSPNWRKSNGAKESSIKSVDNLVRAKNRRIHKPRKSHFQNIIKQDLKVEKRTKKTSKVFHQRSWNRKGKHMNNLRSKTKIGKSAAFHKKKRTDPIMKLKKIKKNKPVRLLNNKLKNKQRRIQKKKTGKHKFLKRQPKVLKNIPPTASSNNPENKIIKKDVVKNVTIDKKEFQIINKDVIKNVTGDKKKMKHDDGKLQISTPKSHVTSKSTTVWEKAITASVTQNKTNSTELYKHDQRRLNIGGVKDGCIYKGESCIRFNRLFDSYPDEARKLKSKMLNVLDGYREFPVFTEIVNKWSTDLNSKGDSDAAIYILTNFMGNKRSCHSLYMFPSLHRMFPSITEPCE